MHKIHRLIFFVLCLCFFVANYLISYGAAENFLINARLQPGSSGETQLVVQVSIPPGFNLYAGQFQVEVPKPSGIIPLSLPAPQNEKDVFSGEQKLIYVQSFTAVYLVENLTNESLNVKVSYQGCDEKTCFLPASKEFRLQLKGEPETLKEQASNPGQTAEGYATWFESIRQNHQIVAVQSGYMDVRSFLSFLDLSGKSGAEPGAIRKTWQIGKLWLSVLLMILGGLALNLTPCVLPLIPVNLAIIGAGVRAASVRRGFLLGTVYGLGIVLAYGALGLITVLTGAQFGAINASPWFNLAIALIFLVLGLALLDIFMIDLTRFQAGFQLKGQGMFFILVLGTVSALLAGACVAPVVIAVLLLATDLYAKGQIVGLLMPFFLGIGMALPWPFAAAGLSFLPKPGRWMIRIKQVFAVIVLLTALYYFSMGSKLLYARYSVPTDSRVAHSGLNDNWLAFPDALADNKEKKPRAPHGKPVLVYFWSTWCKNCKAMSASTFKDAAVRAKLGDFVCVKYQAENPGDKVTSGVLREFGVLGLPTFVVLQPKENEP